ncbi:mannose-ethanolamine phosphotransferase gpi13 [Podila horticola]|nr:mannose-ethanolamine phosphotransferase gpi13 [Podila horticola]
MAENAAEDGLANGSAAEAEAAAKATAAKALAQQPAHPRLNLLLPTATLSSIQWPSAFIGIQKTNFFFSPILVVVNTLGPFLICAAALPLVVLWKLPPRGDKAGKITLFPELTRLCLMMMMHQSLVLVANMFFTGGMFRRHLMVWKVFAPRFMLQATALLSMDLILVTVAVLLIMARVIKEVTKVLSVKIV